VGVFSPVGASSPSAVTISAKSTPTIRSLTLSAIAGTESTLTFSSAVVAFEIQVTDNSRLDIATTLGNTATNDKWSVYNGSSYHEEFLTTSAAKTFYIASNKASTTVQIKEWV